MATFKFNNKTIYIDGRLKEQIDKKIIPDLEKKDKDAVFCIDGKERSGKSKLGDSLAAYITLKLGTTYDITHICMTPEEFKKKIMTVQPKSVVIYDEAHRGMGSRRALSEVNKILIDLMMEMGQKNLCVFIILPTYFMLDRYPALYRTNGLFHVYENKRRRGFWCYFNEKSKKKLFILGKKLFNYNCIRWPRARGRFYDQWAVDKDAYLAKKRASFEEKPKENPEKTRYMMQRDLLLRGIWADKDKLNIKSKKELVYYIKTKGMDISYSHLKLILRKNTEKEGIGLRF